MAFLVDIGSLNYLIVHRHPNNKHNFKNYISTNSQMKRYTTGYCSQINPKCLRKILSPYGCYGGPPCHME